MKDPDMFKVSNLIIRALENLKIKEYYIIGHSMGGMLAQILSTNNNSSVIKMVLSCTHKGYSMKYKKPPLENHTIKDFKKDMNFLTWNMEN